MNPALSGALGRATTTLKGFTPGQKAVTALALVAIVVGGLLFSRWAGQPTYAPLFTGLAGEDASAIVEELNAAGTPYQLEDGGSTILVPRETVYDTRIAMSGQGLPAGEATGYALLDEQSMTSSEFQQTTAYKRALEGELGKTIGSIEGVEAAVVHLAIPEKDVFTDDEDRPTASVLVETQRGRDLGSQQVQAVVNLVSSSVEGMDPDAVTVADATGRVLSSPDGGTGGAAGDLRSQQTRDYEDRVSSSLQAMLDKVVGPGHSVVRLTADLDYDQTQTTSESYTDPRVPPLADSTESETYTGAGAGQAGGALGYNGVLGPDNDTTLTNGAGAGGADSTYEKTKRTVNNSVNKVTEVRKAAPGTVRKLNVAVLLDTRTAGTVDPAQVQALVTSAAGVDAARGDTIQVSAMPFDDSAEQSAAAELAEAKAAEAAAARNALFKGVGLAALALLALLWGAVVRRRRRKKAAAQLSEDEKIQLEKLQAALELQAANEAAALEGASEALALEAADPVDPRAGQLALARDEINEMVQNQPEQVAQLLRGWMADRRS
ncbi:flagellar basal-body MS-ring/collar protein FliF [Vallicoccus soli]|uniref:Flagellar M-ring protein n=1 Tax=Vallicoccus soli TaxID=2339232 RepID=A0A3A3YSU9_9ACTN|nr:flagellar basal-body MS-ring/collar protein FliF [Vallicoccus soli]RJK92817.1 flagellar M-ring protein FliF [Vallicoccus soli]